MDIEDKLFCYKNFKLIYFNECRSCEGRRKCTSYQMYIQPELPFIFKKNISILESQDHPDKKLKAISKKEFRLLRKEAVKRLSPVSGKREKIIRLKMYEILNGI